MGAKTHPSQLVSIMTYDSRVATLGTIGSTVFAPTLLIKTELDSLRELVSALKVCGVETVFTISGGTIRMTQNGQEGPTTSCLEDSIKAAATMAMKNEGKVKEKIEEVW